MVNSNPGFLSTLSATPNTRIVDGTDNIHSGIINALNVATGGNAVISGFNITQEDGGTYTQYDIAAGKILRDGILVEVSARNNIAPGVGARADNDWYATVVVDSSNVIQIRTGGSGVSTASVSTLSASDIPVAIIKYPAGTDHDAVDRPVQFLGYNGSTRGLSILNSGSETLRINANATLTKGSATLTLPSSTGTLALTSDITYTSAISEGNSGLVPSGGVGTSNIADDAVTYAKLQNVSGTDKILGRDSSGAGIVEELTPANVRTMLGIETGATADQSDAEIETAYHNQVAQVSSAERTAGNSTAIKRYAPADIKSMIDTHQTDTNTDVTVANLKTKLNSDFGGDFTIGTQSNDTAILSGHLTVGGNLTVNGATQTINSTVVTIDDPVFTLGGDSAGVNDDKDRGIEFKWHDGANAKVGFFGFDDSVGKFTFIPDATNSSEVFSGTAGTIVANLEGAVTGNASTATALATSRNFSITGDVTAGAVGFTGAGNVALSTTLADDAVATAKIADDAVTSAKIADGTIATGNLADDSVTFAKMQDTSTNNRVLGATTAGTIGEVQVATAMVADDAITTAKIADDAVGVDQLASNAVVNASIASNAAIAQSKVDGLVSALSGKEPSLTISDGLDRTGSTLKVDIDGLTIENGIDRTADFIMYDDATNGLRRINPANLFGLLIASDIPDISSAYRATGTAIVNADISNSAAISADKIANGSTNKVFTSTLKTKLDGIEASATAGADFSSNVSNISVTNAQLAGSIANSKLANSGVTINSNSLNLGGTLTLDTDDIGEGSNKYYTDERVDDRVNALITDGEGITTTYDDSAGTLNIAAEEATTSNKGVASFSSTNFDVSSGAVTIKAGGVSDSQVASNANIAQSKIANLVSNLSDKVETLSDLSITSSATELNVLDGIPATLTATELGYVDGVTSSIQTQLNSKLSSVAVADLTDINSLSTSINNNSTHTQLATAKAVKDYITQQQVEDKTYTISATLDGGSTPLLKISDQFGGSSTVAVTGGDRITTTVISDRLHISDSGKGAVASASFNQGLLTLTHDDGSTTTATLPDSTTDAHGLMTDDQFDKLAGIEAQADVTDKANVVASLGLLDESDTLYLGDAGNDTTVRVRGNLFVDGTTTTINQTEINVQDAIKFEGASADDHETTLRIVDPTADRVISLPDITGTLITTGDTGTIATGMIAASAVTTGKINSNAISTGKLAGGAVTTAKIADDAVTGAKIGFIDDSIGVTSTHIMVADGTDYHNVAVSGDATLANTGALTIGNSAITTAKINNLAVTTAKIAADAITGAKIADDAINSEHYTDGSIDEAHLADNAVTVSKISGLTDLGSGTVISSAERTKLSGIETSADVTDATNVAAAGALMDGDFTSNGFLKRTGAGSYSVDTNTYITSLATTGLTDISQLETNLASITDDHAGLVTAKAVKAYVDSIPGGVGGMSFVLEDGDGTELTIANDKEIKFVPSSLLTINWTDTSDGSDSDPYDLTFTVDNDLANYDNSSSSFATTTALTNATAATAITGKALTNLGSGTGGNIAATDTILAAMQKLETRTALNDAKVTNTDVNVNVSNLTARLPQITESVTIGDGTDVTVTTSGALVVTGNLTVNGTTTTLDTTNLAIEDKNIILGTGNSGSEVLDATGLTLEGGSGDDVTFQYNASADRMELKHGTAFEDFKAGTVTATFVGDLTGDVTGNADTATTLATARSIAGKSFNGSADITIATTDLSDISALDTDLSSVSASHDSLATAKAIKTYVDAQIATEDTIAELNDTNISSLSAGHLLIYDATAGVFDNAALTAGSNTTITNADGAITIASSDTTFTAASNNGLVLSGTAFSIDDPVNTNITLMSSGADGSATNPAQRTANTADQILVWDDSEGEWAYISLAHLSDFAVDNGGAGGIKAFKTISVSGQDDIVADASADTLTLTAGSGITIANTAASDTIAFSIANGDISNAMLANDSVSFGGVSLDLGQSDATPAFDLTDATNYPTSSLTGTITNAQLAGSIANSKLANSSITVSDGSNSTATALGGTITFSATANETTVAESSGTVTIGLPDDVTLGGDLSIAESIIHSGDTNNKISFGTDTQTFTTSGTNRMFIGTGNIGIGTTNPVSLLHLHKNAYDFDDGTQDEDGDFHLMLKSGQNSTAGDAVSIGFAQSSDGSTVGAKISHVIENSFSRGALVFSTNNTASAGDTTAERMRITGAGNVGIGTIAPSTNLHISDDTTSLVTGLLVENVGSDGNSATVSGIEIKNGAGTDSSTHIEQDAFGITRMYTGQGAKNEFLHVSADAGTFTIAGDLKVSGNDIKSSSGDTVITLSNDDATFADNLTIGAGNKLFIADSFLRDDGSNLKVVGESQTQYQVQGQYGGHIFYVQDGSGSAPNNYTQAFKVNYLGNLELGSNRDRTIAMNDTAHDTAGKDLTISAGDTTAGTTDNIAGGDLIFEGGIGKGTGAGGDIIFKVANAGSSGSTLNTLATAMTISDDTTISTASDLTVSGNLIVSGSTTTVNTATMTVEDHNIVLGSGNGTGEVVDGAGLTLEGGSGDDITFQYNTTDNRMELKHGSSFEDFKAGTITGTLSGNASTATALATARNIHGVSFDGTSNIDLSEVIQDTVGAMFSSNTETNITATYQDGDGTIDLEVAAGTVGDGLTLANGANNRIVTATGSAALNGESNLTFDGSTMALTGDFNVGSGDFFVDDSSGTVLVGKTATTTTVARKFETDGTMAAASADGTGTGFNMKNSEGEFLIYTDGGNMLVKDYAGSDTYPFKIMGAAETDTLKIMTGGDVRVKDRLGVGTDSPSTKLEVVGDITAERLNLNKASGYASIEVGGPSGAFIDMKTPFSDDFDARLITDGDGLDIIMAGSGKDISLKTNGTQRIKIEDSLTTVNNLLTVKGSGHDIIHLNRTVNNVGYGAGIIGRLGNSASTTAAHEYAGIFLQIEDNTDGAEAGSIAFNTSSGGVAADNSNQHAMQITSAGRVGIGTTSPSTELHLSGASHPSIRVTGTDNANADPAIELLGTADDFTEGGQLWYDNGTGVLHLASIYNNDAADIQFHTKTAADRSTSNVRMTIAGDGNVGIGTTSPETLLHLDGTTGQIAQIGTGNSTYGMHFADDRAIFGHVGGFATVQGGLSKAVRFCVNNGAFGSGEVARFDTSGNFGIGTTSPSEALHVAGNIRVNNNGAVKADGSGVLTLGNTSNGQINVGGDGSTSFIEATSNQLLLRTQRDSDDIRFGVNQGNTESDDTVNVVAMIEGDTGNFLLPRDDVQLVLGAGSDLKIYHDGSNSYIDEEGTGSLIINSSQVAIKGGADAAENMATFIDNGAVTLYHNNVAKFATSATGVTVTGTLSATAKSFDIEHPTEEGKRLKHGSLEGPEHGVYIRGRLEGDVIELPDYWLGLVDEDTITVQLTPNKGFQQIYVDHIEDNKVYVGTQTDTPIDCFYFIQAERKDVEKMVVEY